MRNTDLTRNFFELFDLPVGFEIDLNELAARYRSLQSTVHPDKYASAGDLERRLAVQQSARINEGFQTLKDPLRRARYLLELNGMDISTDTDTAMDPEFLFEQMALRERLEDVLSNRDPHGELLSIHASIDEASQQIIKELTKIFSKKDNINLESARNAVRRLQFMARLHEEAEALEEQLL
jgi:molecular chaperone HscB